MKKSPVCLLGIIFIFSSLQSFSQTSKIESLKRRLRTERIDSIKINILYQLGSEYWDFDFEEGLKYSQQCLLLAQQIKSPKGLAMANTNLGLYHYFKGDYPQANEYYKTALYELKGKIYGEFPAYTLTRIGNLYRVQSQFDSAMVYYQKSLDKLEGQSQGIALSSTFHNRGLLEMELSNFDSAINDFKTSEKIRTQLADTLLLAETWRGLGSAFTELGEYDSARKYFNEIQQVAQKFKNPELEMFYTLFYADLLYQEGKLLESIAYLNKSLDLLNVHPFERYRVTSLYFLGKIFSEIGEFEKGSEYLFEALRLNKPLKNEKKEADIYYELAWIFAQQRNQKEANQYAKKALNIYSRIPFEKGIATSNNMLGTIAFEWEVYDSAIFYYEKSIEINRKNNWLRGLAVPLFNLALVYEKQGNPDESYALQLESLQIEQELGNPIGVIISYNSLGRLFFNMKKFEKSNEYLLKGRALLEKVAAPIYLKENALFLAELSVEIKDFKKAAEYYKEYAHLSDSLYTEESLSKVMKLNSIYQLEEKDNQIRNLSERQVNQQLQLQQKESQLKQQKITIVLSALTIIFFGAFSFTLYRYNKKIAKARDDLKVLNFDIQEKNEEIEAQSEELTEANMKISTINEELEKKVEIRALELKEAHHELDTFFYRSSHDFRRPLTTFIGLAEVAKIAVNDKMALTLFDKVRENATSLDKMLKKLQSMSIINSEELIFREISFKEMIIELEKKFHNSIMEKNIKFSNKLAIAKTFNSYPEILEVIFENLFENGIDFNGPGGYLGISIKSSGESVIVEFENTGEGLHFESIPHVFEMFFRGSSNSKGNGLGLFITKKAVEKLKGTIHIVNASPESTIFSVELPITTGPYITSYA